MLSSFFVPAKPAKPDEHQKATISLTSNPLGTETKDHQKATSSPILSAKGFQLPASARPSCPPMFSPGIKSISWEGVENYEWLGVTRHAYLYDKNEMNSSESLQNYPNTTPLSKNYLRFFGLEQSESEILDLFNCNIGRKTVIKLVGQMLELKFAEVRDQNKLPYEQRLITAFHSVGVPGISIKDYFNKLAEHIMVSEESLLLMLAVLNIVTQEQFFKFSPSQHGIIKVAEKYKEDLRFNPLTAHRLVLTCLLCIHKFHDDDASIFSNATFANVGGVKMTVKYRYDDKEVKIESQINCLERALLDRLDGRLPISPVYFRDVLRMLVENQSNFKDVAGAELSSLKTVHEKFEALAKSDFEEEALPPPNREFVRPLPSPHGR